MKSGKKYFIGLLISLFIISLAAPVQVSAAAGNYGLILGDRNNNYQLVNNLVVISPEKNLMIKAYTVCKKLGLAYGYNSETKKLIIKNPVNGKSLVYVMGKKAFTYYAKAGSEGITKTAAYQFYYDSASQSYVVHMSTLKYILTYNYYDNLAATDYAGMGYKAIAAYSINSYSSYDIPVTDELVNYVNQKYFSTKEELLDAVRLNVIAHKTGVVFNTNRGVMDEIGAQNSIYDLIVTIDSKATSKDADYLTLLINRFAQSWSTTRTVKTRSDGRKEVVETAEDPASLTIDVQYETTLAQERAVDSRVAEILKSLKLEDASDYTKVKKIHDYVINLASYDTTYRKSSAYDILFEKTAVCEGYTLAAYRLFTDAGLDCKIISGYGDGEAHAWNIVKVDGKWYNIDLTWDDPITNTGEQILRYDYFLKSDRDFTLHERSPEYKTAAFVKAYPIAKQSYES